MEKKHLLDAKEYLRNRLFTYNTYSSVYKIFNTLELQLLGAIQNSYHTPEGEVEGGGGKGHACEKGIFYLIYNSKTY